MVERRRGVVPGASPAAEAPHRGVPAAGRRRRSAAAEADRLRRSRDREVARRALRRRPVLALVPGDRRGDPTKIAAPPGAEQGARRRRGARFRRADRVRAGRRRAVPAASVVERARSSARCSPTTRVWVGAGSTGTWPCFRRRELVRLTKAAPVDCRAAGYDSRSHARERRDSCQQAETEKIWMNGELVDWDDAKIHVGTHGLHYGTGVFEGIRCYDTPKGPAVFRLGDHLKRLSNSAKLLYMELPYSPTSSAAPATSSSPRTACPSATCARSRSTATASSASPRATTRSRP